MTQTKLMIDWDHTASICAAVYNSRMGVTKQNQMIDAAKLNPYRKQQRKKGNKMKLSEFAAGMGVKM